MYGELHLLVQSVQGGEDSSQQSRQRVQQRGHFNSVSTAAASTVAASTAAASVSPTLSTIIEDPPSPVNLTPRKIPGVPASVSEDVVSKEQEACHTLVPQERTTSHDQPMVLQEDAPN